MIVLNQQTSDQRLVEGQAFSFALSSSTFSDMANIGGVTPVNAFTYSATLDDGTALPSWISFDPTGLTFSGVAPSGIDGTGIRLQATDSTGVMSEEAFHLYADLGTETLTTQQDDVQLHQGPNSVFSVVLPVGSFADSIVGQTTTLSAMQTDGTPLPAWLTFDPTSATLTGTSPSWNFDQQVEVLATASNGVTSAEAFHIRNEPLALQRTVSAAPGSTFSVDVISAALPPNVGQISVRSLDGSALPDSITATGVQMTVPGLISDTVDGIMPTGEQKVSVLVDYTPVDATQQSTTEVDISLVPSNTNPLTLVGQTSDQRTVLNSPLSFSIGDIFNYGSGGGHYTITGEDGNALPSWLTPDAVNGVLSGVTPGYETSVGVVVTDTDSAGFTASEEFHVYTKAAVPVLQAQTSDVRVVLGNTFSTTIMPGVFTDPDGGDASVSVTGQGGAALPSWLSYDAVTGVLSGTAPSTQTTQNVVVTATGKNGGVSAESFNVYDQPDGPVSSVQQDDLRISTGSTVSVVLDPNAFSTASSNPVTLTVTQQDGTALPSWLTFNAATATLSGNDPTAPATVGVEVIATDTYGRTAAEGFKFISSTPPVATSGPSFGLVEGGPFAYDLTNIFHDQVGSTSFSYSGTFTGSDPTLASLAVSSTGSLTGNVPTSIPSSSVWYLDVMAVGNQGSVGHQQITIVDNYGA